MTDELLDGDTGWIAGLGPPTEVLRACFRENCGVRIGQCAVASRQVHTVDPSRPQTVTVLKNADAGRIFYRRPDAGSVCHLDIFHQCGRVDHRLTADLLKKAVESFNYHTRFTVATLFGPNIPFSADLVDIQTATGGGRITGALTFGMKTSLRRAHENHVHITAMLPADQLACLFYLVRAAEEAILSAGLELRRNEEILNVLGANSPADLSPYSDRTDSCLRAKEPGLPPELGRHQYLQDIDELADEFESVRDIRDALSAVAAGEGERELARDLERKGIGEHAVGKLVNQGIIYRAGGKTQLTEYGRELAEYLASRMLEIEAALRRSFRILRPPVNPAGRGGCKTNAAAGGTGAKVLNPWAGGGLAVTETVNAAARRAVAENRRDIILAPEDLQECLRRKNRQGEICLVIDASASMTGQRIRAARFLARHLLLATPDRIGVIIFQEEEARVELPFTRDIAQAEASLRRIVPGGSTPLANGLNTCRDYLGKAGVRDPLIILITDGIPTVADHSCCPLDDALAAAAKIRQCGFGFACIGLKPNRSYLSRLAEKAGGVIYVLEELEKRSLVNTVWKEYSARRL